MSPRRAAVIPSPGLAELGELPPDPGSAWPEPPLEARKPLPPPPFAEICIVGGDTGLVDFLADDAATSGPPQELDLDRLLREMWWDRDEAERALLGTDPPEWATAPAGPELAAALDQVRVDTAAPVKLIELMKAATRMQAWAEAMNAAAMAAFWSRREKEAAARAADDDPNYSSAAAKADPMYGAAAEVAAALRLSPRMVHGRIAEAVRLTSTMTETFAALRAGRITMAKAQTVLDGTEHLSPANQRAVQERVLRRASDQTRPQLNAAVRRACAAIDPDGENDRHRRAKRKREISIRPLNDGMAALSWIDSADVIQTAWIALNCLADAAKRTRSEPQSDAADGHPDSHGSTDTSSTGSTDTGSTDTGDTDTDTDTGDTGDTSGGPDSSDPDGTDGPDRRTADQRRCDSAADLFRVLLDRGADWLGRPFPAQHRRRPHIEVLIPITALLGLRDDPCELAGYGPIPADLARRLAAEGSWRRLLTDPVTGVVLEAATSRHDPPAQVSETLLARDQTCRWTGCRMPARHCDRDHVTKFKESRRTRLADLTLYCESHHRLKDDDGSGWHTRLHPDGTLDQTSPTGHRYRTYPPGVGPITESHGHDPPPF